jgi:hypothetical protein
MHNTLVLRRHFMKILYTVKTVYTAVHELSAKYTRIVSENFMLPAVENKNEYKFIC